MAYKRAELLIVCGDELKVIAWVEMPEDAVEAVSDTNEWFEYMATVTPLPDGARFKTRLDYMTNLCPKPRPQS